MYFSILLHAYISTGELNFLTLKGQFCQILELYFFQTVALEPKKMLVPARIIFCANSEKYYIFAHIRDTT